MLPKPLNGSEREVTLDIKLLLDFISPLLVSYVNGYIYNVKRSFNNYPHNMTKASGVFHGI